MTILKRSFVLLISVFACAHASEPAGNLPSPEVMSELTSLVEDWIDAEVEDDREALERIFHDEFLSTFASGATMGKKAYIDFILSLDISPFKVINEATRIYGDTAVVIDVTEDGGTKFTWIAVRHSGDWKVISQTFSNVTK